MDEKRIINSFRKVKEDIENLQHQINQLKEKQEDIVGVIFKKETKSIKKSKKKKK